MRFSSEHPVVRAATRDPKIVARFWAFVERDESADGCWAWRGRRSGDGHAIFAVKSHSVSAARLAWLAATGEFPLGGRLRRTCQNPSCVRPEHLDWDLGASAEQMIRADTGGYVSAPLRRRAG